MAGYLIRFVTDAVFEEMPSPMQLRTMNVQHQSNLMVLVIPDDLQISKEDQKEINYTVPHVHDGYNSTCGWCRAMAEDELAVEPPG